MVRKFAYAAAICAFAFGAGGQSASAATVGPHTQIIIGQTAGDAPVIQVQGGGYCRRWARECAERHGWRNRDWYRCMRRHDCDRDD